MVEWFVVLCCQDDGVAEVTQHFSTSTQAMIEPSLANGQLATEHNPAAHSTESATFFQATTINLATDTTNQTTNRHISYGRNAHRIDLVTLKPINITWAAVGS